MRAPHDRGEGTGAGVDRYTLERIEKLYRFMKVQEDAIQQIDPGAFGSLRDLERLSKRRDEAREELLEMLGALGIKRKEDVDEMYREFQNRYLKR